VTRDYKNVTEAGSKQKKSRTNAKTNTKTKVKSSAEKIIPGWIWLVSGVVIGGFVSFIIYLKLNVPVDATRNGSELVSTEKQILTEKPQEKSPETVPEQKRQEGAQLEFYKILPNREVVLPEDDAQKEKVEQLTPDQLARSPLNSKLEPELSAKPGVASYLYTLQVGSFLAFKDADKRKANLAMLGIGSRIYSVKAQNITRYRVLVGPYKNIKRINEIEATMKVNKIKSLLLKEKG